MQDLYRLVYASRNLLKPDEAEAAIVQILAASRRNNEAAGVTGALMFNAGAFAQVLEGPRRSVEATFERIQRDLRHSDVTVLQCGPVEARGFANWAMAFVGQSGRGRSLWSGIAAESGFDPERLDGDAVLAMLHGLVLEEEDVSDAPSLLPGAPAADGPPPAFDPDRLRAELAALQPAGAAPAGAAPAPDAGRQLPEARDRPAVGELPAAEGALAVLREALAEERARTTSLRGDLDDLRVALALVRDEVKALRRDRDRWAERARLLAAALHQEAEAVAPGPDPARTGRKAA
ncbi:BLUF domain-containing protein [Methylobacterium sp. WSM2598]|uniref:BLUF domain-containing protein n=1 Tax=Methylobacterium sp. WSM2598 TaxID=398261 RepID=UPI000364B710|nr:BLUF domain-containing protein [Methylobacterium sp. WSM2598]